MSGDQRSQEKRYQSKEIENGESHEVSTRKTATRKRRRNSGTETNRFKVTIKVGFLNIGCRIIKSGAVVTWIKMTR